MNRSSKSKHVTLRVPNEVLDALKARSVAQRGTLSHTIALALSDSVGHCSTQKAATRDGIPLPMDIAREVKRRSALCEMAPEVIIAEALREHWRLDEDLRE